jgi:hypothetical protein
MKSNCSIRKYTKHALSECAAYVTNESDEEIIKE